MRIRLLVPVSFIRKPEGTCHVVVRKVALRNVGGKQRKRNNKSKEGRQTSTHIIRKEM
jgi:hypothetical protein